MVLSPLLALGFCQGFCPGRTSSAQLLCLSFVPQSSSRFSESRGRVCSIQKQSEMLVGQLLGYLILCCAEEDQDIRHDSMKALHGIHGILAMRQSKRGWDGLRCFTQ